MYLAKNKYDASWFLNFLMVLMSFLALTLSIFNFFKRFSDLNLALNFQENDVKHENKKYFFLSWPYGENAATSGGWLALF